MPAVQEMLHLKHDRTSVIRHLKHKNSRSLLAVLKFISDC